MYLAHSLDTHPIAADFDPMPLSELREFMAGDDPPVDADPVFRERLREQLWTMVSAPRVEHTSVG